MSLVSLGKVTADGVTPSRLTKNESDATARFPVHSFLVEQLQANTGKLYVGSSSMDKATGAGVYAVIPIPTLSGGIATVLPSFSATVTFAPVAFNLADVYLDVDNGGEGATVSAIIA